MKVVRNILPVTCLLAIAVYAKNDKPFKSSGDINFIMDYYVSYFSQDSVLVDFSFATYSDQFKPDANDSNKVAYSTEFEIKDSNGLVKFNRSWTTEAAIPGKEELLYTAAVIKDSWYNYIEPGLYSIKIKVVDSNGKCFGYMEKEINIGAEYTSLPVLSDIRFLAGRKWDDAKIYLEFCPTRSYGLLNPVLYFSYEITREDVKEDSIFISYKISDISGNTVKELPQKKLLLSSDIEKITDGINVSSIGSGIYKLNISVKSLSGVLNLEESNMFEISQYSTSNTDESVASAGVADFVKDVFQCVASPDEMSDYDKLTDEAKSRFLNSYFTGKSSQMQTGKNAYLAELYNRYKYANENFGWAGREGWKSDRGRILIKYGMPEEINHHFSEIDTNPYAVWIYEDNRRFEFIFGDLRNDGRLTLLHATIEGETSNPYWKEQIIKTR